jgi:hypothetical protein
MGGIPPSFLMSLRLSVFWYLVGFGSLERASTAELL